MRFVLSMLHAACVVDTGKADNTLNKVIRPKSRASALSKKSGRQTDKQFVFKKTLETAVYSTKFLLYHSETIKRFQKPLKQSSDGPTD